MVDLLFGWLLRGKCDLRALDGIIFVVELVLVFVSMVTIEQLYIKFKK